MTTLINTATITPAAPTLPTTRRGARNKATIGGPRTTAVATAGSVRPTDRLHATVGALLDANTPLILWGPPGVGKTRMIESIARDRGWHLEVVLGSIREPQDIAGFPAVTDNGFSLLPPDYVQRLIREDAGTGSILFLDEVSNCSPAQQAALLRVGTDRVIGDVSLPDSCRIVFVANPPEQAADGWQLAAPLANRMVHLKWPTPDASDFVSGLLRNWGMPDETDPVIREHLVRARGEVAGFISARPDFLHKLPGDEIAAGGAWPSPRSWADLAVPALAHAPAKGDAALRQAVERDLVAGSVGEGVALEFLAWRDAQDLPDPAHLLEFPDDYSPTSDRADQVHATLASVAAVAINRATAAAWASAWVVLGRAADAGHAEVAAVGAWALIQARPNGADLPPEISKFSKMLRTAGLLGSGH